ARPETCRPCRRTLLQSRAAKDNGPRQRSCRQSCAAFGCRGGGGKLRSRTPPWVTGSCLSCPCLNFRHACPWEESCFLVERVGRFMLLHRVELRISFLRACDSRPVSLPRRNRLRPACTTFRPPSRRLCRWP